MTGTILHDYWRSSSSYRLRIALGLIGIDYLASPVDLLAGHQRSPENMARNPQGLVPTLEIDGLCLTQSLAVLEYLDEVHDAGFLPVPPAERARVRAISCAIAMEIQPVCNLRVAAYAATESGDRISAEGWMRHFMCLGLEAVEAMLGDCATGTFCHGDKVGMADICLVPQIYNARRRGIAADNFPRAFAIAARLEHLPAFAAAAPRPPVNA